MGLEPPRSFPISWYCKLDTGMQQPKLHPELQMQQKLQVDLLLRLCQFHRTLYQPGMVLHPSRPHSELVYFNSPPQVNFAFKAKSSDQEPGTTQHRGQFSLNLNNSYDIVVSTKINTNDKNIVMNISIQSLRCHICNYFHLFLFYEVCIVNVFFKKKIL